LGGFPAFDDPKKGDEGDFPAFRDEPAKKPEVPKTPQPKPPPPRPASAEPSDLSFDHFLELVHHSCWDYNGPSPAELFGQKDRFASADEAFAFLVNET
jgi:hypothetical protein